MEEAGKSGKEKAIELRILNSLRLRELLVVRVTCRTFLASGCKHFCNSFMTFKCRFRAMHVERVLSYRFFSIFFP